MEGSNTEEMEKALPAIASMIERSVKAQEKFLPGTSQHTLQKNRINALQIAANLIGRELGESDSVHAYTKADLENAVAPIASLISKSEKARRKIDPGAWQHAMLERNLKALTAAVPLLQEAIRTADR